jgi:hypothetical protein
MLYVDTEDQITSALLPFCTNPVQEIYLVKETFANVVKNQGPNQWNPFVVFFKNPFRSHLVVQSKPVDGYENILASISEIFSLYPAINSHAALLVLDVTIKDELDLTSDALKLFFVSPNLCTSVTIPYTINGPDVTYLDSDIEIDQINTDNFSDSYKDLYVVLFTYTHIDNAPYSESEVCSYLTYAGHYLQHLNPDSHFPYISFNPDL